MTTINAFKLPKKIHPWHCGWPEEWTRETFQKLMCGNMILISKNLFLFQYTTAPFHPVSMEVPKLVNDNSSPLKMPNIITCVFIFLYCLRHCWKASKQFWEFLRWSRRSKPLHRCSRIPYPELLDCFKIPHFNLINEAEEHFAEKHFGELPLFTVVDRGYYDMGKYCITHGTNVNHETKLGNTAADVTSSKEVYQLPIKRGANLAMSNNKGENPIKFNY